MDGENALGALTGSDTVAQGKSGNPQDLFAEGEEEELFAFFF